MAFTEQSKRYVAVWLAVCVLIIFSMVVLGGAVRLTGSGLSMVEWRPLIGVIPPISHSDWIEVFGRYKQFPEYKFVNQAMNLAEFKFIFLMEYAHRLLGRIIGIIFIVPFIFFLVTARLDRKLQLKLGFLLILGAIQGFIGWYMVQSGLVNNPHVSQYRLTLHFMIATIIYAYILRILFGLYINRSVDNQAGLTFAWFVFCALLLMLTTGGFVAGTRAGFILNSWPLMAGSWIPTQMFALSPWWMNLFENSVAIQFIHRWLAVVVFIIVVSFAFYTMRRCDHKLAKLASLTMIFAIFLQFTLGLFTLLLQVPVLLGIMHQAGALLLMTAILFTLSLYLPASI